MPLPAVLADRLRLPIVAAPMFLVSGPELVIACCRAGIVGSFPALNERTTAGFASWLDEIESALTSEDAPYAVNLIVHPSNQRVRADLEVIVAHRVPIVITSLGAVPDVVDAVHSYGGLVFHDVTTARHARKSVDAGVDGLILVAVGAGGHAGTINPFALLAEVRSFFDGTILLAGAISSGSEVLAAQVMGADLAYLGTRFIATTQSRASDAYRQLIVDSGASDIVYTPEVSSIPANFLKASLEAANLGQAEQSDGDHADLANHLTAWRDIWSAGQGVAAIDDIPDVTTLVDRLEAEYHQAASTVLALRGGGQESDRQRGSA